MDSMGEYTRRMDGDYGYFRVASAVPQVNVADVKANVQSIMYMMVKAEAEHAQLLVLPELALTGYTCGDLLANDRLLDMVENALTSIYERINSFNLTVVLGAPLRCGNMLLNCAVVMNGLSMGVVPKSYIPNYKEFYEKRWFTSGLANAVRSKNTITVGGMECPFGTDLLFRAGRAVVGIEVCEDLWTPIPPTSLAALNGANVLVNLSASNELVSKHDYLMDLIKGQSARHIAAYVYSSSGFGESTTDLVFAGNAVIAENGSVLAESKRFSLEPQLVVADIDIESLNHERRVNTTFADAQSAWCRNYRCEDVSVPALNYDQVELKHPVNRMPFVPAETDRLNSRCEEIVNIQTMGLMRRLKHTGIKSLVVGISGGLDSTLALMVACRAFDQLGLDRKGIYGITMPGFGTTGRTLTNALELMRALGITVKEIPIADAVAKHLADIEHSLDSHDTTYENAQARERTQILMDYANKTGSLVLGTGDLSELALGWCTYNGDHMSMYNVNGGVPKTLAKHLVMWFADQANASNPTGLVVRETLLDVLHTPISPELTPADDAGNIKQKTEDIIGPYELHDFFLYNMIRHGYEPRKIFFLARKAFGDDYDSATIKH
ncbi:MAG: NAD(+) synthase, partial [Muribaculaceae bacterium]|nr:NAD(+) synthase [Muribaculaceae bacterium]